MAELTLSQAMARIEAKRRAVDEKLARMPSSEWSTPGCYALCSREQELHIAVSVLREVAKEAEDQAANAAAPR